MQFVHLREESPCDLDELCAIVEAGLATVRNRADELVQARSRLGHTESVKTPHIDMHRKARQHYQALLLVLKLLEHRSEMERAASAPGEAAQTAPADDGDGSVLWVRLGKPAAAFVEGRPVTLIVAARRRELRVHTVAEDEGRVAVSEPPEPIPEGTAVHLKQQGRFPLGRHQAALDRFLSENVEGNWTHLARLLCEPARLPVVDLPRLPRFFDTSLNDEQRVAVSGAAQSPHTYFVPAVAADRADRPAGPATGIRRRLRHRQAIPDHPAAAWTDRKADPAGQHRNPRCEGA